MHRYPLFFLFLLTASAVSGGEYNPVLSIGDAAPAWKDLPGTDGKKHSFAGLKDHEMVVVVFTCNGCPYAIEYEDRIISLAKSLRDHRAAVVAINVNKRPEDSFEAMKKRADEKRFNFPYLYDETQQIARDYGATYTPEFFVLDRDRKIVYMGALDDSPDAAKVQTNYVTDAIAAARADKTPQVTETVAIGCRIQLERKRRRRKQ